MSSGPNQRCERSVDGSRDWVMEKSSSQLGAANPEQQTQRPRLSVGRQFSRKSDGSRNGPVFQHPRYQKDPVPPGRRIGEDQPGPISTALDPSKENRGSQITLLDVDTACPRTRGVSSEAPPNHFPRYNSSSINAGFLLPILTHSIGSESLSGHIPLSATVPDRGFVRYASPSFFLNQPDA